MRFRRSTSIVVGLVLWASVAAAQQPPEPIRYTLRFPAPQTHYVEVEASVPTGGRPQIELIMAVWTPGSYLVREYERNVERVTASARGRIARLSRSPSKNRWRIETGGAGRDDRRLPRLRARGDRTLDWVDADFAMLNGAPTFLTLPRRRRLPARPHDVQLELPPGWKPAVTGLPGARGRAAPLSRAGLRHARRFPIVAGNPAIHASRSRAASTFSSTSASPAPGTATRREGLRRIVATQAAFWGSLPVRRSTSSST